LPGQEGLELLRHNGKQHALFRMPGAVHGRRIADAEGKTGRQSLAALRMRFFPKTARRIWVDHCF